MSAQIIHQSQLELGVETLLANGIMAIPTETVYGLAANAFSIEAVTKIFVAKERPLFDPLIVHVAARDASLERLELLGIIAMKGMTPRMRKVAEVLIQKFWPGPLTLLLPRGPKIPDLVTSGLPEVGVRVPSHPLTLLLLSKLSFPLAAPSANKFGRISPTTAQHVWQELAEDIPVILDGGACAVGVESTVLRITDSIVEILRPGQVTETMLSLALSDLGMVIRTKKSHLDETAALAAPGMLASHYAPRKPLQLFFGGVQEQLSSLFASTQKIAILGVDARLVQFATSIIPKNVTVVATSQLSETLDPQLVARHMFSELRRLDESDADQILVFSLASNVGLWHAINDRFRRASCNKPDLELLPHVESSSNDDGMKYV